MQSAFQAWKYFLSVSKSFVWPGTSFDLTRRQSGWTKHVFPSHGYANWYCGPVIKLKHSIFVHKLCYIVFTLGHKYPITVSDQANFKDFAGQNLNFTVKFVVLLCQFCKVRRDFGFFCSINHLSDVGFHKIITTH